LIASEIKTIIGDKEENNSFLNMDFTGYCMWKQAEKYPHFLICSGKFLALKHGVIPFLHKRQPKSVPR
jgi:hypothetical protein